MGSIALAAAATWRWSDPVRVPEGLAGARFGMNEQALTEHVSPLTRVTDPSLPAGRTRLSGTTLVLGVPATCRFDLAHDQLVRIECLAEASPTADAHEALEQRWLAALRGLYGGESTSRDGLTAWYGSAARLELTSKFEASTGTSILRIVNERVR